MGVYNPGRPQRCYQVRDIPPNTAGEYRVYDSEGTCIYIGESADLRRRMRQHMRAGRFDGHEVAYIDVMIASIDSDSETRREHERASIAKHRPKLNKSRGGEGRPAGSSRIDQETPQVDERPSRTRRFIRMLIIVILVILAVSASLWLYGLLR